MSDAYVILCIETTYDEYSAYSSKDSAEIVELAWIIIDSKTLEKISERSIPVRPLNNFSNETADTNISWEHLQNAVDFSGAIEYFDASIKEVLSDRPFSLVSFIASDSRVQIIREARDKNIVLPSYFQYPRYFDLKTEYNKWHKHHPELPYTTPLTISTVCASLGIDTSLLSERSGFPQPKSLPMRASEDVVYLAKILCAIIEKSQPISSHQDIFHRPVDSKADITMFIEEASPVIFLSNLPHDITQGELESWFTQYGLQPIDLWTLRTADQFKSLGNGFVVFNTHGEASESLNLNGRCLNDRVIEVSPSSHNVLDRASEILTHFPQSKNRPRPGDWNCPSCGFSNFQRRTACFRCMFPIPGSINQSGANFDINNNENGMYKPNQSSLVSNMETINISDNSLQMNAIEYYYQKSEIPTNENEISQNNVDPTEAEGLENMYQRSDISDRSENYRGKKINQDYADGNGKSVDMKRSNSNINGASYGNNSGKAKNSNGLSNVSSSVVPFRAGDWKCGAEGCNYHNFAKNANCLKCGASRVSASMIMPDNSYENGVNNRASFNGSYNQGKPQQRSQMQNQLMSNNNQRYRTLPKQRTPAHRDNESGNGRIPWQAQNLRSRSISGSQNDRYLPHTKYQNQYEDQSDSDSRASNPKKPNSFYVQKQRHLQRHSSLPASQHYQKNQRYSSNTQFYANHQPQNRGYQNQQLHEEYYGDGYQDGMTLHDSMDQGIKE